MATVAIALIFMIWIAISKAGAIRLGPDHSKPQYSLFSWSARSSAWRPPWASAWCS
nr:BCCT family transporter [uncultured Corynebacterium sp.]